MRKAIHALVLLASGAAVNAAAADNDTTSHLTIHATGFESTRGHAIAKLFAPGDNVLGAGHWQLSAPIEAGAAMFHFSGLVPGRYAVVVFHDLNDNSVIDHGLLGPSEPLGFSGGFTLSLFSRRPDFERLQFELKAPAQTLEVSVR